MKYIKTSKLDGSKKEITIEEAIDKTEGVRILERRNCKRYAFEWTKSTNAFCSI